ncbi:hypothetical protein L249_6437 [Ophiocordyceps polyrhachis-furcata BCC 54312]|uniref:Uncharacterized protein n=1 Tax=Ophiocordyceps polyrhachis-furcata BCC 54312 TaxID=1330021 RepID=A0A367LK96_9HYPO|nr:hypothetical protein L249_6437 [Ophiocordyceps polyrhachis-furcata BCC 54312]
MRPQENPHEISAGIVTYHNSGNRNDVVLNGNSAGQSSSRPTALQKQKEETQRKKPLEETTSSTTSNDKPRTNASGRLARMPLTIPMIDRDLKILKDNILQKEFQYDLLQPSPAQKLESTGIDQLWHRAETMKRIVEALRTVYGRFPRNVKVRSRLVAMDRLGFNYLEAIDLRHQRMELENNPQLEAEYARAWA